MTSNQLPLVSVVTAFYNEEDFLEETIRSVLAQTYTNWELILVDDGSPDRSRSIARRFAQEYPDKIFHYHHDGYSNRGVCKSRNLGISKARGEFIAYLDADDIWLKEKLERQLAILRDNPEANVVIEASTYWYSWATSDHPDEVIKVGTKQDVLHNPPGLMIELYPLGPGAAPCPSGVIARKVIHDRIRFVEEFVGRTAVYEDQAFLSQIYACEKVWVSSQANNLYRQRANSQVYRVHNEGRYHEVRHYFLNWLSDYLKQLGHIDPRVRKLLRKALLPYRHPLLFKIKVFLYKLLVGKRKRK